MNDWKERQMIQGALAPLRASPETLEEVLHMKETKRTGATGRRMGKGLLIAAVLTVALMVSAAGVDYAVNRREVFFFDSLEAMTDWHRQEYPDSEVMTVKEPGSLEESRELETVAEGVARVMERGSYDDETLLLDEVDDTADTLWERRVVRTIDHEDYGPIRTEYTTGAAYAEGFAVEGLLDWDISTALASLTPDEGGQLLSVSRNRNGEIVMANALLGYGLAEGGRFVLEYDFDRDARFYQGREAVLSCAYDTCELYTTADGVEVLVEAYDGQVWAQAWLEQVRVNLYAVDYTVSEVEAILEALELSVPMAAGVDTQ